MGLGEATAALVRLVALVAALLATSCACNLDHVTLDQTYWPLKRIQASPTVPAGVYQAFGDLVLTRDPCDFVHHDQVDQEALLRHEQIHAITQRDMGLMRYLALYNASESFRFDEEVAGWRVQLRFLGRHGRHIDPEDVWIMFRDQYRVWNHDDCIAFVRSENR